VLLGRPAAELVLHPLALGVAELVGRQIANTPSAPRVMRPRSTSSCAAG
jgi:hypothetical protein